MGILEGKVAIVTGGRSGFGRAMSLLYAKEGAKVVVSDIVTESGEETVNSISKEGGEAIFVKADVDKPEDCENLVKQAVSEYKQLNLAFNELVTT